MIYTSVQCNSKKNCFVAIAVPVNVKKIHFSILLKKNYQTRNV